LQPVYELEYIGHRQTHGAHAARLVEICQQMNSNNTPAVIRSLIIYAVVIPLAVWIGYLLAAPTDRSTFNYAGILALILLTPILLRWHHFLLIAGLNFGMTIFFLPGSPPVGMLLVPLSLGISIVQRAVNSRAHFLSAPELTRPLLFFLAVILFTAKMTGGIGLHALGSEVSGGKRYMTIFFGIAAYFALTAVRIPPKRVALYVTLYFLVGFSIVIGDLATYLPSSLNFLFAFFPATGYDFQAATGQIAFRPRYAGVGNMGLAGVLLVLSRYGPRGIFLSGKLWRLALFGVFFIAIFFGGFRSALITCGLTFAVQFYMERLHRTRLMPFFAMAGLIGVVLLIPFASKLPYTFQRTLAFLPLNISKEARQDAQGSSDWRLDIWRATYPKVPQYLLLGKGYAITADDLAQASNQNFKFGTEDSATIAQNYHSGPLSVLMPFGAWGAIALLWFWFASVRALHDNYRYGDPAFKTINTFLFAYYIVKIFMFLVIFGGIENDLAQFAILVGLSVSINGGIRRPALAPQPVVDKAATAPLARPRFQPFYQR
jgi:hypothetical protein